MSRNLKQAIWNIKKFLDKKKIFYLLMFWIYIYK